MHELPYNLDAEKATLGSVLLNRNVFPQIDGLLSAGMFYLERHQQIYTAMRDCAARRVPPDTRLVAEELRRRNLLEAVGGVVFLSDLTDAVPTSYHALHYAGIVQTTAFQRAAIDLGAQIAATAYATADADELRRKVHTLVNDRLTSVASSPMRDLRDVLWEIYSDLNTPGSSAVSSGLYAYDLATDGGLWPGELVVPASRPGQGKSTLVGSIAANIAARGVRVDMFSLEMQCKEVARRLLAAESRIDSRALRRRELDEPSTDRVIDTIGRMEDWPIRLESARTSVDAVRTKVLQGIAERGPVGLVVVDYIQLLTGSGKYKGNRVAEIGEITHALKDLAMEADCTVLAPAQMSRAIEQRASPIPTLADLRESGDIENDADKVLFMVRPDMMANGQKPDMSKFADGFSPLIIYKAKDRNGDVGEIKDLLFDKRHNRIVDLDRTRTPEGY